MKKWPRCLVENERCVMRLYRASVKKFGYAVFAFDPDSGQLYRIGTEISTLWSHPTRKNFRVTGVASKRQYERQVELFLKMWPEAKYSTDPEFSRYRKVVLV